MRYFGYGSSSSAGDSRRLRPLGPAWLPDHALGSGALGVRARVGSATPGVLFEVDDAGWVALDRRAGPEHERVERPVLFEGHEVRAQTHVARDADRDFDVAPFPRGLFVYGTLRRGEPRARLLEPHARSWVAARARGALVDLGEYPGLVADVAAEVEGELVELEDPAAAFAELDPVEEFLGYGRPGSLYRRDVIAVGAEPAWTYRYLGPPGPRIASGDWRRRC